MITLKLARGDNYESVPLRLPTTPGEVDEVFAALDAASRYAGEVQIIGVDSGVPSLAKHLKGAGLTDPDAFDKLNRLAEKIDGMDERQRDIFSGALDAESAGSLDDVLRVSDSLEAYTFVPNVRSDEELGRYVVVAGQLHGDRRFPEEAWPYQTAPTRGNASEFITRALEDNYDQIAKRDNYVSYIASRPRAQRAGAHALFTGSDAPLVLSQIAAEVAHHPGNVWLPIISLRREDAARLGYDDAGQWKNLIAGYAETAVLQSIHKDWNEDVKARCGLEAQSAEEHPQLMAAPEVCKRVCAMSTAVKLDRLNIEVPWLIEQYRAHLHWGRFDQAMDCMEQASALAVAACRRELRQLGMAATEEELAGSLCERIRPHRNRGNLKNRHRELAPQFQSVLAMEDAVGFRTQEEKKTLAGRWLDLAAAFAGVPIQYEPEQVKQREAQPTLNMELGVTL